MVLGGVEGGEAELELTDRWLLPSCMAQRWSSILLLWNRLSKSKKPSSPNISVLPFWEQRGQRLKLMPYEELRTHTQFCNHYFQFMNCSDFKGEDVSDVKQVITFWWKTTKTYFSFRIIWTHESFSDQESQLINIVFFDLVFYGF